MLVGPANPNIVYKNNGWTSWGDWLGTDSVSTSKRNFKNLVAAREFVQSLGLQSLEEWRNYCKGVKDASLPDRPTDIPTNPHTVYAEWIDYGDWLGTGNIAPKDMSWRPFNEARAFVHTLKLSSGKYWRAYSKGLLQGYEPKPDDIPSSPDRCYQHDGWLGMGDWLGTETEARRYKTYRSYEDAEFFARSLHLQTYQEWKSYCQGDYPTLPPLPNDIPKAPHLSYKKRLGHWKAWGEFLGTGRIANKWKKRTWMPFEAARRFARSLGLKKEPDWRRYCSGKLNELGERPQDIPADPRTVYRNQGWVSMSDWLGTKHPVGRKKRLS